MARTNQFDKLNTPQEIELQNIARSIPIEQYFDEMDISDERKEKRIKVAKDFESKIIFVLLLISVMSEYDLIDWQRIETEFRNAYLSVLSDNELVNARSIERATKIGQDLTRSTQRNIDEEYFTSMDRATTISETETSILVNYDENEQAMLDGYTYKTWNTMRDKKVRHTHEAVDGKTIQIDQPFTVGGYHMQFPADADSDAPLEEICGCRCWIEYS